MLTFTEATFQRGQLVLKGDDVPLADGTSVEVAITDVFQVPDGQCIPSKELLTYLNADEARQLFHELHPIAAYIGDLHDRVPRDHLGQLVAAAHVALTRLRVQLRYWSRQPEKARLPVSFWDSK